MTKVEAIKQIMLKYNGVATLQIIYNEIELFYPDAKRSKTWEAGLRGVLYRDIGKTFKKLDDATYSLIDYDIANYIPKNEGDIITEKEVYTKVRTLQYKFRESLLKELKFCPVTRIIDRRLLLASHIKPWCVSTDFEKTDTKNGFILSPLYDKLFDSGLITFTDKKVMLISPTVSAQTKKQLNLQEKVIELLPVAGREKYLEFHNEKIFIK